MAEFEAECERLKLKLEVLPPSKPTYNGGVERANRTFREDFYDEPEIIADSIGALRFDLKNAVAKYNTYRHILTPFCIGRKNAHGVHSKQPRKSRLSLKSPERIQVRMLQVGL